MKSLKRLLLVLNEGDYGRQIIKGISDRCSESGEWEIHLDFDKGPMMKKRVRHSIEEWKADGIIATVRNLELERMIKRSGLPVVNCSLSRNVGLPTVAPDLVEAGRMAARHFLGSGFRNFGMSSVTCELSSKLKFKGFSEVLEAAGHSCYRLTDQCRGNHESNWVANRRRMEQWLLTLPKPVAILCMYDVRGQEIATTCRRLGLRVPDDVAMVGVGNDDVICRLCSPPLSSVEIFPQALGYRAMEILDSIMSGKPAPAQPVFIPPRRIVIRQSSNIVATEDRDVAAAASFIRDNDAKPINVGDILRVVPISRRALERRFVKTLGQTLKGEIVQAHVQRAQNLLIETDMPIPAVAKGSGFVCPKMFAGLFRRKTGMTPTNFRKRHRLA